MAVTQAKEHGTYTDPLATLRAAWGKDEATIANVVASETGSSDYEESPADRNEAIITPWSPEDSVKAENVDETKVPEVATADAAAADVDKALGAKANLDTETLWVKDETGKKKQLDISYSDREKIKDAFVRAAGMRKFQAERDLTKKEFSELKAKHEALNADFSKLDTIFKEKGAQGLFETLAGPGAWDKAVDAELQRRDSLLRMSPAERAQLEASKREEQIRREHSETEKRYKEALDKINKSEETAAVRSLESRVNPVFEKYRFKGKLGDNDAEQALDEAIWTRAMAKLSEYPDDIELTSSILDKEIRNVAAIYKKVIDKQADSRMKIADSKQKTAATERVQLAVKKGMEGNSAQAAAAKDIKDGNWSALLQKAFSGQVKF